MGRQQETRGSLGLDFGPTLDETRTFALACLNRNIRFRVKIRADGKDLEKPVVATNGICVDLKKDFFPPNTTHLSIKFAIQHPYASRRLGVILPPMPGLRWFDSELAVVNSEQFIDECLDKLEVCRATFGVDTDYKPPEETQLDERSEISFVYRI